MKKLAAQAIEAKAKSIDYIESLHSDIAKYIQNLEPTWIHGLIDVEEAAAFEFVVLEDL